MIYLLKTGPYLKIGYSGQASWERRLHQIRNASPYEIEVLAARPGTLEDEKSLHEGAVAWRHEFGGRSWYNDCPELRAYCDLFFFPVEGAPAGPADEGCTDGPPQVRMLVRCVNKNMEPITWLTLEELSAKTGMPVEEIQKQFDRAPSLPDLKPVRSQSKQKYVSLDLEPYQ